MIVKLAEALIHAFEKCLDFSNTVMDHVDDEKYAKAVCELYGQEPTYKELDAAIDLIKEDSTISTEKKIQLLETVSRRREEIYEKAIERKKKTADVIDSGARNKGEIAVKIAGAVMTGGVSLLPDAVNAITGKSKSNKKLKEAKIIELNTPDAED